MGNNDGAPLPAALVRRGIVVYGLRAICNRAVSVMAVTYRGLYLVGSKRAQTIRAVQIVDSAGKHTMVRLSDYVLRGIEPKYKTLPWQEDLVSKSADSKPQPS